MLNAINFDDVIKLAKQAGAAIMEIYNRDFSVDMKADESPLTEADLASHHCIVDGLKKITPHIPVLSEESTTIAWQERSQWQSYWLIDPLDGTKEFIKRNGEFTVNIALIVEQQPVWGVVYAPAKALLYYGGQLHAGSVKESAEDKTAIHVKLLPESARGWKIVGSKSHQSDEFAQLVKRFDQPDIVNLGSSLKICMVAEGSADLYPRLGLTSEWDTAAAHAVLQGAGGEIYQADNLTPLRYNTKENLLNPFFHALGKTNDFNRLVKEYLA
ncbi:3'(2'),5'-bisphosphate nucleotidase CysQ [Cellvibrio fibrivorans]|jgi:3'(2'), 5'-bisphosphate nucleotidase|uniref:3'(2'),5'-bisphosphate nucleotidase CysQ n=1 Tax=Cellvibrio fibrivorans TaxID=126350 RepID=A0ABU1UU48_9GAMM|nr:3'(2'),5'-bisphosphate nucleotidase CysQ [Cellvibrio fibrivorans]MDR7088657.1 3'(2'), 5'-bisphosphate nucleotidase [Cellvibrio fibrivorans]